MTWLYSPPRNEQFSQELHLKILFLSRGLKLSISKSGCKDIATQFVDTEKNNHFYIYSSWSNKTWISQASIVDSGRALYISMKFPRRRLDFGASSHGPILNQSPLGHIRSSPPLGRVEPTLAGTLFNSCLWICPPTRRFSLYILNILSFALTPPQSVALLLLARGARVLLAWVKYGVPKSGISLVIWENPAACVGERTRSTRRAWASISCKCVCTLACWEHWPGFWRLLGTLWWKFWFTAKLFQFLLGIIFSTGWPL